MIGDEVYRLCGVSFSQTQDIAIPGDSHCRTNAPVFFVSFTENHLDAGTSWYRESIPGIVKKNPN